MILVKAKRDELLAPLASVSGIIERRHTLPILSNVLIERNGDALGFLATDIEIQIAARSAIEAPADKADVLLAMTHAVQSAVQVFGREFAEHFGTGCPRPREIAVPKILDVDQGTGAIVYDERYRLKRSDWTYAEPE